MTTSELSFQSVSNATATRARDAGFDMMSLIRQIGGGVGGFDVSALRSAIDLLGVVAPDLAASLKAQLDAFLSPVEKGQLAAANDQSAAPGRFSTVGRGDTLGSIAARNGVSLDALLRANPQFDSGKVGRGDRTAGNQGRDPDRINIGERIALPAGGQTGRASPATRVEGGSPATGPLDPGAASVRASETAETRVANRASSGSCYRFVKEALLRAGVVSDYIPGVAAKDAGPALEARGFTNILTPGSGIRSAYDAPVGAVLVYGAAPGAADRNARYGHIEIRTANGFASDYFSPRARTGPADNGLEGRGRVLIGVYVKPDAGTAQRPATTTTTGGQQAGRLGDLSMVYETGKRPSQYQAAAGVVSSGRGDPGGKSYGAYQLASQTGTLNQFLRAEGARWAPDFRGMDPTVAGRFEAKWREIATREPEAFFNAQHDFIQRTKYDRVVEAVKENTGVDLNAMPAAVRDAVWSMGVQHGRAVQIITGSINTLKANGQLGDGRAVINRLYDDRVAYVNRIDLPSATRASLIERYVNERAQALNMLGR